MSFAGISLDGDTNFLYWTYTADPPPNDLDSFSITIDEDPNMVAAIGVDKCSKGNGLYAYSMPMLFPMLASGGYSITITYSNITSEAINVSYVAPAEEEEESAAGSKIVYAYITYTSFNASTGEVTIGWTLALTGVSSIELNLTTSDGTTMSTTITEGPWTNQTWTTTVATGTPTVADIFAYGEGVSNQGTSVYEFPYTMPNQINQNTFALTPGVSGINVSWGAVPIPNATVTYEMAYTNNANNLVTVTNISGDNSDGSIISYNIVVESNANVPAPRTILNVTTLAAINSYIYRSFPMPINVEYPTTTEEYTTETTTEAPTSEAPTSEVPTSEAPTEAPTSEAPTSEAPTSEAPTSEETTTEETLTTKTGRTPTEVLEDELESHVFMSEIDGSDPFAVAAAVYQGVPDSIPAGTVITLPSTYTSVLSTKLGLTGTVTPQMTIIKPTESNSIPTLNANNTNYISTWAATSGIIYTISGSSDTIYVSNTVDVNAAHNGQFIQYLRTGGDPTKSVAIQQGSTFTIKYTDGTTRIFTCNGTGSITGTPVNASGVGCFLKDAPVLTPAGYRRIDSLKVGDLVQTAAGPVAIQAVKVRAITPSASVNPYVIPKGHLGATRDLAISPDHKVQIGDKMIEARFLCLAQKTMKEPFAYYNLELPNHENMTVAGVTVESQYPIQRVAITMAEFRQMLVAKYGTLTPSILARVQKNVRMLADGRVEVPVDKRSVSK